MEDQKNKNAKYNAQEHINTVLINSVNENSYLLIEVFKEVKNQSVRKKLFDALDIYNQMIFNDLDDIYVPEID